MQGLNNSQEREKYLCYCRWDRELNAEETSSLISTFDCRQRPGALFMLPSQITEMSNHQTSNTSNTFTWSFLNVHVLVANSFEFVCYCSIILHPFDDFLNG